MSAKIDCETQYQHALTDAQWESVTRLRSRFSEIENSGYYDNLCDCLMLHFKSALSDTGIWIGIELDGYAHS